MINMVHVMGAKYLKSPENGDLCPILDKKNLKNGGFLRVCGCFFCVGAMKTGVFFVWGGVVCDVVAVDG